MAIVWQKASIPMVGGIATKDDEFAMEGRFLALENVVFTKRGQLIKRNGHARLGSTTPATKALFTRRDELLASDGTKLRSYAPGSKSWLDRGDMVPVEVSQETVAKITGEQSLPDRATNDGITVFAWEDSETARVRYSIYDSVSGACLVSNQSLSGSSRPRLIAVGNFIHLVHYAPGARELRALVIKPQNLTASLAATPEVLADDCRYSLAEVVYNVGNYVDDTHYLLAYTDESGDNYAKIVIVRQSGHVDTNVPYPKDDPGDDDTDCLDICGLETGHVLLVWGSGDGTFASEFTSDLVLLIKAQPGGASVRVTCAPVTPVDVVDDGGTTSTLTGTRVAYVWWEADPGGDYGNTVTAVQWIEEQGTASPISPIIHSSLASRGWQVDGEAYAIITTVSTLQTTYFMMRGRGGVVESGVSEPFLPSRFLPGIAGGIPTGLVSPTGEKPLLPQVEDLGDGIYAFAASYKTRLASIDTASTTGGPVDGVNAVYTEKGIKNVTFDFNHKMRSALVGNTAYMTGGLLWQYDGRRAVEAGFLMFIENVTLENGASGAIPAGSYSYRFYPEWTNEKGERELGTCSAAFTITADGSKKVVATVPTIAHTHKRGDTNISIAAFRTEVDPTDLSAFHRVSSLDPSTAGDDNGYIWNDPTSDTVTFIDNFTDAELLDKQLDYRNSGEPPNLAPEPASIIVGGQDRLLLAGFEDPNKVQFSKLHFDGDVVTFFPAFEIHCDEEGGPVTALAMNNETIVIFKENSLYRVDGDGPNNVGQGGYGPANLVRTDVGCTNQASIVGIASGVIFKSSKGFYLLDQGFGLTYIGADVEKYNDQDVTAATLIADKNQVRFLTSSGVTLMYDYFFQQWSTFTRHEGIDAALWDGSYVYARNDGSVGREVADLYTDFGSGITMAIETAWLKFAGIQGFQRIRKAIFLGRYLSPHTIRLSYQYNYQRGLPHVKELEPQDFINTSVYGTDDYGVETPYGGDGSTLYQFWHGLRYQKCESVRFRIEDVPVPGTTPGASFVLTDMTVELGGLPGVFRLGKDRRAGSIRSSASVVVTPGQ